MNTKISLAILAVVALVVGAILFFNRSDADPQALASQGGKVTVVEYLDLECPACGAAFPGVEKLRSEYGDKVDFQLRHFPLPMHRNAEQAAVAVEAAGSKRDEMFHLMYSNQQNWAGKQTSQRETFLGYARSLGLDIAAFEKAMDDPATLSKVSAQRTEGASLGVNSTPTFFVNGTRFEGAPTYAALKKSIDSALAK
ncbi:disulfide bond formation protein DsbA [Lentzea tibetensis]|uniref:Disulfide bond formation protein DsbA n=1 Tax=Lentzea tibetensis TaxID=2591470 RepID=A0A563ET04_9PSEU|nr:thioredoxin domain-containing protein [Lentzea tibetensis]TWP50668.1 disulfide bond formation protein DsbA [Lentzea tibetensis]